MNKNSILMMGVANATPDSFSDGGEFLSSASFKDRINFLKSKNAALIDIGAESTAPSNQGISHEEEIRRLEHAFSDFSRSELLELNVSFDTYKIETIKWILKNYQFKHICWNDIGSDYNDEVCELLNEYQALSYIACHHLCPSREETSLHMSYLEEGRPVLDLIEQKWLAWIELSKKQGHFQRMWWDPCFGFSKTRAQNEELLRSLSFLRERLQISQWVLGISKKSFLQESVKDALLNSEALSKRELQELSEYQHIHWLRAWIRESSSLGNFYIRLHNPDLYHLALTLN